MSMDPDPSLPTPVYNVRIREDLYLHLRAEARRRDRSVTAMLKILLEDHYHVDPDNERPPQHFRPARAK